MSYGETPFDHVLVVNDDPADGLDVEHAPDCPYEDEDTPVGPVRWWRCAVADLQWDADLDPYFLHASDPDLCAKITTFPGAEKLDPGRYPLGAWWSKQPGGPWGPTEYDGGLQRGDRIGRSA